MKTIVITGSTRGIGFGMADAFLQRGHQVVISGRSTDSVTKAVETLSSRYDAARVLGQICDVSNAEQAQALWDAAADRFGRVDIWINNAGISHRRAPMWELSPEKLAEVTDTNLLGVLLGSRVSMIGMISQGGGQLYNMEGLGSGGSPRPLLSVYGATKSALTYLTKGLMGEAKGTPVQVGLLSPGIVVTDLLSEGYTSEEWKRVSRIFNILADKVETVAPFLVDRMLANTQHGVRIAWLTTPKVAWRFLTARIKPRQVVDPLTIS